MDKAGLCKGNIKGWHSVNGTSHSSCKIDAWSSGKNCDYINKMLCVWWPKTYVLWLPHLTQETERLICWKKKPEITSHVSSVGNQVICCGIVCENSLESLQCQSCSSAKCEFNNAHNKGVHVWKERCCAGGFLVFIVSKKMYQIWKKKDVQVMTLSG